MATQRKQALATRAPAMGLGAGGLFEEFDRFFDQFRAGLEDLVLAPRSGIAMRPGARMALVDVKDTGNEIIVQADLPGVKKDDLEINVTENNLELRAEARHETQEQDKDYYFRERAQAAWYRLVPPPAEVIPDKAEAELKDGVLTVRIPRKEPVPEKRARKVPVK